MQIINTSLLVAAYWKMWLYDMQVQEKKITSADYNHKFTYH